MKIKYEFANGDVCEVEVTSEIGSVIIESRKAEQAADRRCRYHSPYSIEALDFEGIEYADPVDLDQLLISTEENSQLLFALRQLSDTQRRRILMLAGGMSLREISRCEGIDIKSLRESINGARKKFLKFM